MRLPIKYDDGALYEENGNIIELCEECNLLSVGDVDNLKFIVKCVNNFQPLRDALESVLDMLEKDFQELGITSNNEFIKLMIARKNQARKILEETK